MMFSTKNELLAQFTDSAFENHPVYSSFNTFSCLRAWKEKPIIELSRLRLEITGLDYLTISRTNIQPVHPEQLKFQQNGFRLWYQIDGTGILQNTTRGIFGIAKPGLLGIMERGERYSYLHQKGDFECFQLQFSLLPSHQTKCYWNSEIEGKVIIDGDEQVYFECGVDINYLNIIFRRETGKTLYQYITGVRMEHAKYLLETSGFSVITIADQIGYPNSNSFTRAFKRHTKKTPNNYRCSFKKLIAQKK